MAGRNNNRNVGNDENNGEIDVLFIRARNISGDLNNAAQAIANAFQPLIPRPVIVTETPSRQAISRQGNSNGAIPGSQTVLELEDKGDEGDAPEPSTQPELQPKKVVPKRATEDRRGYRGSIDDNIQWDGGGTPFVEYYKKKSPTGATKIYLVIAAWFKLHGGKNAINSNLVYNAYRKIGMKTLTDITQPFRSGIKPESGYYSAKGDSQFAITNIGLDKVNEMGKVEARKEGEGIE